MCVFEFCCYDLNKTRMNGFVFACYFNDCHSDFTFICWR